MKSIVILGVLSISVLCTAYPSLQKKIPNGDNVPHPCNSEIWQGVGHHNYRGGGERNPFGVDFKANSFVWNSVICNKDSDGDGVSNGEELGDPACNWSPGQTPARTSGLSHPGVCEPLDSPKCGGIPSWLECGDTGFDCPAIKEAATFNFTVRFPETPVPAVETSYICMSFEFPTDQEYHMVANQPYIDNMDVMHHILLYGCARPPHTSHNTPYMCDMGADQSSCADIIGIWAVGVDGECLHSQSGFLIGGQNGYKYGAFQFHWNNPLEVANYVDSSGMIMHLTPSLRPYNAGVLMMGQSQLNIPPGQDTHIAVGKCGGVCTRDMITNEIYVSSVFNHMHYMGHAQFTELRRNGKVVTMLAEDPTYDYASPVTYSYKDAITVLPGDEIKTTCIFSSKKKTKTTHFGDATSDEMCLSFIQYFPKERMPAPTCLAWKSIDSCLFEKEVLIQGCNKTELFDPTHPAKAAVQRNVMDLCSPLTCRLECLNYVKELKKTPCYRGDVYDLQTSGIEQMPDQTALLQAVYFFAAMNSCDAEIARMELGGGGGGEASAAMNVIPGCALLLSLLGAWLL